MMRVTRVVRVAQDESADTWTKALESGEWVSSSQLLKEDGGSWVRRTNLLGRDVVVKCRALNTIGRRIKAAMGIGHGAKQWWWAWRLIKAGILTGRPMALARAEVNGQKCEVLVLEFVPGKTLLEVLDEIARAVGPGVKEQHAIARAVGNSVMALRKAGLSNRDHKPSNLIVGRSADGGFLLSVIDTVGIESDGGIDGFEALEMIEALMVEPLGCGCLPRRSLWMRALSTMMNNGPASNRAKQRRNLRRTVKWAERAITSHGDPRPRVNPLSRNSG